MMIKTAAHFMTDPFTIDSPNFNHNGGRYVLSKIDMRTLGVAFFGQRKAILLNFIEIDLKYRTL